MTVNNQEQPARWWRDDHPRPGGEPLIVGEVLFDCFPDGNRVLGGAPFNVAWNLQGLNLQPKFLSAIGDDQDGRLVQRAMEEWGMDSSGLQMLDDWPTGRVEVELADGQPTFKILADQAYDHIKPPTFPIDRDRFTLLYLGSLAFRGSTTRQTIEQLIDTALPRFVDINIRQPWFDREWIPSLFSGARWVKLNESELAWITRQSCDTPEQIEQAAQALKTEYSIAYCLVTRGSEGACLATDDNFFCQEAPPPAELKDTVGAGDAFASATILGICHDRPVVETLHFASQFASLTCGLQGGTTADRLHFEQFLESLPFATTPPYEA